MNKFKIHITIAALCLSWVISLPVTATAQQPLNDQLDFANGLYSRNMYEMAIVEYEKITEQAPDHPQIADIQFRLAESHFFLKKYAEAAALYLEFLERFSDQPKAETVKLRIGETRYHQGQKEDAAAYLAPLTSSANITLKNTALFYLGKLYYENGQGTQAYPHLVQLSEASESNPYWEMSNYYLGDIKIKENRFDEAAVFFERMRQSSKPDLKQIAAFNLGKCAFQKKDYAKAAELFLDAHKTGPHPQLTDDAYINYLNALFLDQRYIDILSAFDDGAVQDAAKLAAARLLVANSHLQLDQFDDGIRLFDLALNAPDIQDKDRESAELGKLEGLLKLGRYDEAKRAWTGMNQERNYFKERWNYISAELLKRTGQSQDALVFYNELSKTTNDADYLKQAMLGQAYLLLENGNLNEAYDALSEFINKYPASEEAAKSSHDKILIQVKLKNWSQAIQDSITFLKRYPDHEKALSAEKRLASLYLQTEDYEQSYTVYKAIMTNKNPDAPQRAEILFYMAYAKQLQNDFTQALQLYQDINLDDLTSELKSSALKNEAYIFIQLNRLNDAALAYQNFIRLFSAQRLDDSIYNWLYDYFLNKKEGSALLEILDHAGTQNSDAPQINYYRGEGSRLSGAYEQAINYFDRNINASNEYALKSYFAKGLSLMELGRLDEAKETFETTLTLTGQEHATALRARMHIAEILAAQGLSDESAKAYLATAILYDEDTYVPLALWHAGNQFARAGRADEAGKAYNELIDRYPDHPRSAEAKLALEALV